MAGMSQVEQSLRRQLEEARKQHEETNREFWRICADVPSGLPAPDGALRIQNAARAQNVSRRILVEATVALTNFLRDGKLPADVADSAPTVRLVDRA